ncbi:MAG: tetratricopeptide repeat protein [Bacteroidales bacterium]
MKPLILLFCCLFTVSAWGQDMNSALKLINSEQYEEAEKVFDDLIKKDPANGDLYYYYGEALLKDYLSDTFSNSLNDFAGKAEQLFQEGLKQAPGNVLNQVGMGALTLLRTSDTLKALPYFQQAEAAIPLKIKKKEYTPQKAVILTKLAAAQLYGKVNNTKKAIAYLNRAKVINPNDPNIYLTLGDVYINFNDASNALANYNQALMKDPKSPLPKIKIGNIYMRVPNLSAARPYFEEAREIDSTFAPVFRSLGELWSMGGRHDLAKQYFYRYMQLSGNTTPAKLRYANSLFRARDYSGAIEVYDEIIKVDNSRNYLNRVAGYSCFEKKPQDLEKGKAYMETFFANAKPENIIARDYSYYGRMLYKLANGDSVMLDKAFENLKKAYSMDESDDKLLSEIASNYYYSKRYKEAIEMFEMKAQKGKEGKADAIFIARAYYNLKDFAKAEETFAKIVEEDPSNIDAHLWLARNASNQDPENTLGLAAPKFEAMINQIGTETDKYKNALQEAYSYFGYFNITKKEFGVAKDWYNKIIALDATNKGWQIGAYSGLAMIASKEKNWVEARNYYQKILDLDPSRKDIKQGIEDLTKVINAAQK